MLLSLLLFAVTLSLLEMYRAKFASSELMTIAGGFVCSLLFLLLLTVRFPFQFLLFLTFYFVPNGASVQKPLPLFLIC
jgi:hypothetical protein